MRVGKQNFTVLALSLALSILLCTNQSTWAQSSEPITKNQSGPTGVVGDTTNSTSNGTQIGGGSPSGGSSSSNQTEGSRYSQNNSILGSALNMFGDSNNQTTQGKLKQFV